VLELLRETVVPGTRAILAPLDERPILDAALLKLSHWVGQYYLATLGEVFGTILPPSLRSETQRTIALEPGTFYVSDALEKRLLDRLRQSKGKLSVKGCARNARCQRHVPTTRINRCRWHCERLQATAPGSEKIFLESASARPWRLSLGSCSIQTGTSFL
jgi:primosomal protein N'